MDSCSLHLTNEGRGLLDFEDEVLMVTVTSSATNHSPDVSVDGLDHAEGKFVVAVAEDPLEMALEELRRVS